MFSSACTLRVYKMKFLLLDHFRGEHKELCGHIRFRCIGLCIVQRSHQNGIMTNMYEASSS